MKTILMASIAVLLSGCWLPPSASVRPGGMPRTVADRIEVEPLTDSARVEAVDRAARTVELSISGVPRLAYKVGPGVRNWSTVHTGDEVRATIKEVLNVYVGSQDRSHTPRVLVVEPSYRLLTVQYPNGGTETFKITLHTPMKGIEAGDSIVIRAPEVIDLRAR
jgi:hypothetical protein